MGRQAGTDHTLSEKVIEAGVRASSTPPEAWTSSRTQTWPGEGGLGKRWVESTGVSGGGAGEGGAAWRRGNPGTGGGARGWAPGMAG